MKKIKLDKSERDILTAYESGELKSVMTSASSTPAHATQRAINTAKSLTPPPRRL